MEGTKLKKATLNHLARSISSKLTPGLKGISRELCRRGNYNLAGELPRPSDASRRPPCCPDIPTDISISEETNFCPTATTRASATPATATRCRRAKSFLAVSHLNLCNYRSYSIFFLPLSSTRDRESRQRDSEREIERERWGEKKRQY